MRSLETLCLFMNKEVIHERLLVSFPMLTVMNKRDDSLVMAHLSS